MPFEDQCSIHLRHPILPDPPSPRRVAVRPDPTRLLYVRVLESTSVRVFGPDRLFILFAKMSCMKMVYKIKKKRWFTGRQLQKGASRLGDKPLTNRLQTACPPVILFPRSINIILFLFVILGKRLGDLSSMPWGVGGTLSFWANCSVGVSSCPAPPCHPPVRLDATCPWYVRVLDSTYYINRNNHI